MSRHTVDAKAQAVAEWRTAHHDDDDIPDEAILTLTTVQARALRIALTELRRTITQHWHTGR